MKLTPTMKVKILSLQSFLDVSIQYTGSIASAFAIAIANNKNVTDTLVSGDTIILPEALKSDLKVLQYYSSRAIIPATGLTAKSVQNNYQFPYGLPMTL